MKNFKQEFEKIMGLLENNIPFCFQRYSDGEMFILQNKEVNLAPTSYKVGDLVGNGRYTEEEQKHFLPGRDEHQRKYLTDTIEHTQKNYLKGIPCRSDTSEDNIKFMKDLSKEDTEDNLTFANVLINSNYPLFINRMVPFLSNTNRDIAIVCNIKCDISKVPFKISKDFRIGNNCLENHIDLPKKIAEFMSDKKDWILLCSAASLSNIIGYECFKSNPNNTIIDIGSSLNPILGLEGWKYSRDYLKHYWLGIRSNYCEREEVW